jgi:hypothetical protein
MQGTEGRNSNAAACSPPGEHFTVTRSDQISSRLDFAAVKAFLGDAWRKFETASIATVIRVKSVQQLAAAA